MVQFRNKITLYFSSEFEDLTLQVHLSKPQCKRKIVTGIKAMPESAHYEHIQLACHATFKRRTLINTFPQPFLYHDIPSRNFVSYMGWSFDDKRLAMLNAWEILNKLSLLIFFHLFFNVADSWQMDGGDAQVPACIELGPKKSHRQKCIESCH